MKKPTVQRKTTYAFTGLTSLAAPVPPMLEQAIGYTGEARLVSFYWIPGGDETYYDDGQRAGTGNWQGYLAYVQHPAIHPLLAPYDLGSSDREGTHSLILDRTERTLYVAPRRDAQRFLAQQWPKTEPVHMTPKEWKEWTEILTTAMKHAQRQQGQIDPEDIQRRIEEQYALVEALQEWLDRHLPN
jgi:hypothetical protein